MHKFSCRILIPLRHKHFESRSLLRSILNRRANLGATSNFYAPEG